MRNNPCRYCALAVKLKGKHYPAWKEECEKCENNKKHREYLQSKRQFEEGEAIKSLDELLNQEWLICHGQTRHIKAIKNMQLASILKWIEAGIFKKTIRKELGGKETKCKN